MTPWILFVVCALFTSWNRERNLRAWINGQVLEILTDYDGGLEDIPSWCEKCGQEFLGMEEDEDCYKLYIKKTK
jgi:TusA-related sulfurtransferase